MITQDWKNATPEQIIFWDQVKNKIAWNTITPLYYQGVIAGSEFLIYDVNKLYVALELEFSDNNLTTAPGQVALYDETNTESYYMQNDSLAFNAADVPQAVNNVIRSRNLYFSRLLSSGQYWYMKFNGYILTIV